MLAFSITFLPPFSRSALSVVPREWFFMDLQKIVGSGIVESTLDKLHLEGVLSVEKLATCDDKAISLNTRVPERVIKF